MTIFLNKIIAGQVQVAIMIQYKNFSDNIIRLLLFI